MNNDQIKQHLLALEPDVPDFTVILSGKESRKADGLYFPDRREIVLHNRNFQNDNQLMYTAIHEFAHHVHFSGPDHPATARSHTTAFWGILHALLARAEAQGVYRSIFDTDDEFLVLAEQIKEKFLTVNGELMKELGRLLARVEELCRLHGASFDDFVDRKLLLHRHAAKVIMKVASLDIPPQIGFENMKAVARIRDDAKREVTLQAFVEGKSPDMVRSGWEGPSAGAVERDPLQPLIEEKERIERSIEQLTVRLARVERRIDELKNR